ncbi:MAG: bifunctional folylpolyglutamate synthase/dihydrofolate synthase [Clostridia bacterium]|nr:bifunctional folylpolyglutamate synthase/dihydrofolate synthase [Clostridia bacterium]
MNYNEALNYIHSNFWQGSKPGLERTQALLEKLGNPQSALRFIHVAGTNGKGSFCSMLSSVLIEAGYRVGTYTSPYILRFNERMKVGGKDIPDDTLARLTTKIQPIADSMTEKPTEFELITAIAMEYFKEEKCDVVVLECGMGGRLDSTNVIENPVLSVITGIALDHTAFLGDTVEKIAAEKAGIIKEGRPVVFCGKDTNASAVIQKIADLRSAPFYSIDRSGLEISETTLDGTIFSWLDYKDVFLPLLGTYQPENAQNVLFAIKLLKKEGFSIPDSAVKSGIRKVKWPARFEVVSKDPLIICDGGHNPEGIESAVSSTKLYFKNEKLLVVTGVMADKDYRYMSKCISEIAKEVFCITPENPRALKGEEYANVFRSLGVSASHANSPSEALQMAVNKAKSENLSILCVGSLYMYSQIIDAIKKIQ